MSLIRPATLPDDARNPGESHVPTKSQGNPSRRILVVDDDAQLRLLYSRLLSRSGYQVDAAQDGEDGWNLLHGETDRGGYDLLITDNQMPGLSGVELVKKLRLANMALPVILATSAAPISIEDLQFAAVLEKPLDPTQLLETVHEVLQTAS